MENKTLEFDKETPEAKIIKLEAEIVDLKFAIREMHDELATLRSEVRDLDVRVRLMG